MRHDETSTDDEAPAGHGKQEESALGNVPPPRILLAVLTGFLGSGKTTLLKDWLSSGQMIPTAIVMNEFGAIGIDDQLVVGSSETVTLLGDGCLCCTVRSDLVSTIADLMLKMARKEIPAFQRVVIETTGLADPAPILQTLMTDPLILSRFRLDAVVATIDATQALAQLDRHGEARRQAALADRLVLTKTDLIPAADVTALRRSLRDHNPAASILDAQRGEAPPSAIFGAGLYDPERGAPNAARWLATEAYGAHRSAHISGHGHHHNHHQDPGLDSGHGHDLKHNMGHEDETHSHDHSGGHHQTDATPHHDVLALAVERDGPWPWAVLADAMDHAIGTFGDRLLRLKGVVHVSDTEMPVVIHAVGHIFHPPLTLTEWPREWRDGAPHTRLVAITQDLDPAEFFKAIDSSIAAAERPPESVLAR